MSETTSILRPLLRKYPDARKAPAPLLNPILLPYVALMFGGFIAAVVGSYNALMLKRPGLMGKSLLLGLAAWICFLLSLVITLQSGVENRGVAIIIGRVVHFAFGGILYFLHRPYFRGHEFFEGAVFPLLPTYLVAILISMMMPGRVALMLLGVPFVR